MSRIGRKPVPIESGVKVDVQGQTVLVEGKLGKLSYDLTPEVSVSVEDNKVYVARENDERKSKAMHGTTRALIANMIEGVSKGYSRSLEVVGVGWTAKLQGKQVHLNLGYADTRIVDVPDNVKVEINASIIKVSSADKQAVGQLAARIRSHRKPEPYNGKGIKYTDEVIIRKQGKAFGG